jgi:serine/threonine protein kinase
VRFSCDCVPGFEGPVCGTGSATSGSNSGAASAESSSSSSMMMMALGGVAGLVVLIGIILFYRYYEARQENAAHVKLSQLDEGAFELALEGEDVTEADAEATDGALAVRVINGQRVGYRRLLSLIRAGQSPSPELRRRRAEMQGAGAQGEDGGASGGAAGVQGDGAAGRKRGSAVPLLLGMTGGSVAVGAVAGAGGGAGTGGRGEEVPDGLSMRGQVFDKTNGRVVSLVQQREYRTHTLVLPANCTIVDSEAGEAAEQAAEQTMLYEDRVKQLYGRVKRRRCARAAYVEGLQVGEGEFGRTMIGLRRKNYRTLMMVNMSEGDGFGGEEEEGVHGEAEGGMATTGEVAVMRVCSKYEAEETPGPVGDFLKEAALLLDLEHSHVVRLLGVCTQGREWYAAYEYAPFGDLRTFLRVCDASGVDMAPVPTEMLYMGKQIASGLAYVHSFGITHRNLTTQALLVGEGGLIKVGGLSHAMLQAVDGDYGGSEMPEFELLGRAMESRVALEWAAPEVLLGEKHDMSSDVWSFGVVMWEIGTMCREVPYGAVLAEAGGAGSAGGKRLGRRHSGGVHGETEADEEAADALLRALLTGTRLHCPSLCPNELYGLMQVMWRENAVQRPTMDSLASAMQQELDRRIYDEEPPPRNVAALLDMSLCATAAYSSQDNVDV